MTDLEVSVNLGKIVFQDKNQERSSRVCMGQSCFKSLFVFLNAWDFKMVRQGTSYSRQS